MPLSIVRLFFLFILFPTFANAYLCNRTNTIATVNLPNPISIPPNLNIGDMIGEYTGSPMIISNCNSTSDITSDSFIIIALGTYFTKGNDGAWVIKTSVPGLGFSFGGTASECSKTDWVTTGTWRKSLCSSSTRAISSAFTFTPKVRLYKIGYISPNTVFPRTIIGYAERFVNGNDSYSAPPMYMSSTTAIIPACSVNSNLINVSMGLVDKFQFDGVGTTANKTSSFNISVTCSSASPVSVKITGNNYDASKGILNLVNSSAKGVAIQLFYNNKPLVLNSFISTGKANIGQFTIPLQARYYQTSSITGGTANSSATFTMQYQ